MTNDGLASTKGSRWDKKKKDWLLFFAKRVRGVKENESGLAVEVVVVGLFDLRSLAQEGDEIRLASNWAVSESRCSATSGRHGNPGA